MNVHFYLQKVTYSTFLASRKFLPCYVQVYVVIHICDNMWCVWADANLYGFYRLFINVLLLEIQLSRSEGWDPINQITLQDLDLQRHMSWSFCD
jgi:hypothetical protein